MRAAKPKSVLLFGATGTIGHATADALVAAGHDVVCFVRPRSKLQMDGAWVERGDVKSTFDLESTFADLGLSKELVKSLEARGFEHPTLIQSRLIPPAIAGRARPVGSISGS